MTLESDVGIVEEMTVKKEIKVHQTDNSVQNVTSSIILQEFAKVMLEKINLITVELPE